MLSRYLFFIVICLAIASSVGAARLLQKLVNKWDKLLKNFNEGGKLLNLFLDEETILSLRHINHFQSQLYRWD